MNSYSPFALTGKTILITGASSGIGRACAIEIAKAGAGKCILTGRSEERLQETAAIISRVARETETQTLVCDLSDTAAIKNLSGAMPRIDGAVLNAGINIKKPIQFVKEEEISSIFQINCFSCISLIKHLVKNKKLSDPCSLVFMSSISGNGNFSFGNAMYGASKAALTAFMKYAAMEFASKGVRCNALLPGRVETDFIKSAITDATDTQRDLDKYPLKRYGKPEEVAYSAIFLLSDASAWITGSELTLDGGRSLI